MFLRYLKNIKIEEIIVIIFPVLLITGPALPDIFAVLFSIYFLIFHFKKYRSKIFDNMWIIAFFLIFIWFNFISIFAYDSKTSFIDSIIFFRFFIFTIAIYFMFSNINLIFYKKLFNFFLFTLVFVIFDTLFQFYNYDSAIGFKEDLFGFKPEGLNGRLSGPFRDLIPGAYLARFYFVIILLFIINKYEGNRIINYFLFYTILSICLATIYFTGERMALATIILGLIILILCIKKIRIYLLYAASLGVLLIFLNQIFHTSFNDYTILKSSANHEGLKIKKEFNCPYNINKTCYRNISIQPKFVDVLINFKDSAYGKIYNTSFQIWRDYPITGIGLNNFNLVCKSEKKYKIYHIGFGCTTHPHNLYIQALVESGFIGLFLFIFFIISVFYKILSCNKFEIKVISFVTILTIFWPIMSTGSFLKNWNMIFICFLIGLILAICESNNQSLKESKFKNTK